jgi:hypothetical protein
MLLAMSDAAYVAAASDAAYGALGVVAASAITAGGVVTVAMLNHSTRNDAAKAKDGAGKASVTASKALRRAERAERAAAVAIERAELSEDREDACLDALDWTYGAFAGLCLSLGLPVPDPPPHLVAGRALAERAHNLRDQWSAAEELRGTLEDDDEGDGPA